MLGVLSTPVLLQHKIGLSYLKIKSRIALDTNKEWNN